MKTKGKRIIIMGATSGIGRAVAEIMAAAGWTVGVAGRRGEMLDELRRKYPENIVAETIDVNDGNAGELLTGLFERMGGAEVYLHCSGIGYQNPRLEEEKELSTLRTDCEGYARMLGAAFRYFAANGGGHIAAVTSIAGTKGLGPAPAYSAAKRFQCTYLDALEQLARMRRLNIHFTDIRPGFVDTALINYGSNYPFVMKTAQVARSIVRAIEKRRRVKIIDWKYAALVAVWRLIPRTLWKRFPFPAGK